MARRQSKKSESLEVRVSHEVKQAFMTKAAGEGRSASEIVRHSIAEYLLGRSVGHQSEAGLRKYVALSSASGVALLFALSSSSPASSGNDRRFEALSARLAFARSSVEERKALAKRYATEFAAQRTIVLDTRRPDARDGAYSALDIDSNGRLSLAEYRQLMTVPAGPRGQSMFRSLDGNRDGSLSKIEFTL